MIVSFPVGRHDGALPQPTTGRLHSNRTISLFLGLTRLILRCFLFKDFIKDGHDIDKMTPELNSPGLTLL